MKLIEANAKTLRVEDRIEIIQDSVGHVWKRLEAFQPFDIVLADPPYAEGWEMKLLSDTPWREILSPSGVFCLEWGTQKSQVQELPDTAGILVKAREKNYGDSVLTTYEVQS